MSFRPLHLATSLNDHPPEFFSLIAPTDIEDAIDDANALIGALTIPPVGSDFISPSVVSSLVTALTNYNEGATGPGHC